MISNKQYAPVQASGEMQTNQASIEMTPEMFDMLSSKVYKNKPLAVVREILCNARDAQVEAGSTEQILVHAPNQLEPYLSIRDYGEGLSEQRLMDMYLRYGFSDKRDSNDVIGGLGIGSKSPLAYTDSFIVISIHDNIKTTYSIYKDKGIPQVSKLASKQVIEPSGIEVKVTVKNGDFRTFHGELENFLKYFDYPVKVVGATLNTKVSKNLETDEFITYDLGSYYGTEPKAIMGGVVYQVSPNHTNKLKQFISKDLLLMKFDIGELSVAASRESLSEDKETIEAIEKKVEKICESFYEVLQKEIDEQTNKHDVYHLLKKYNFVKQGWSENVPKVTVSKLLYNGLPPSLSLFNTYEQDIRCFSSSGQDTRTCVFNLTPDNIYLLTDKVQGAIKLSKKLAKEKRTRVVLIEPNSPDLGKVEDFLGKGNFTVQKVSDIYEIYFPKGANKHNVKVAKSGLFTHNMTEVTELDENSEGYYLPFEREVCVAKDAPPCSWDLTTTNYSSVLDLMVDKGIFKDGEIYICRKGGLKAVAKTKIKELTWKDFIDKVQKCYTAQDYIGVIAKRCNNYKILDKTQFDPVWEIIKKDYPFNLRRRQEQLVSNPANVTDGTIFLRSIDSITSGLIESYDKDFNEYLLKLKDEYEHFNKKYPIFNGFSKYTVLDASVVTDLVTLVKIKNGSLTVSYKRKSK